MNRAILISFVSLFVLGGCAPPRVIQFLNDDLDYSQYDSYKLINFKSDDKSYAEEGLLFFNKIEEAIAANMATKNYLVGARPDLIVRYEVISTITSAATNNQRDPYGYNDPYNSSSSFNDKKIKEGIMLIEMRDRKQKKLVWQGSLDLNYSIKKDANLTIKEAIDRIFTSYPYVAGSNEKIIEK
jgi:hypothetical protein